MLHIALRKLQGCDWILLAAILCVMIFDVFILWSASSGNTALVSKQVVRFALGWGLFFIAMMVPLKWYKSSTLFAYALAVTLLLLVLLIGDSAKGAQRWLSLGPIKFQPSELLKVITPMMAAWYLSRSPLPATARAIFIALGLVLAPAFLIAKQPDLGTAILVASSGMMVIFFAGLSLRWIAYGLGLLVISAPALWLLLHEYQRQRILTLLNPSSDPLGRGYHIIQSQIAIGSGGWSGKGWCLGTQSQLEFLPERTTDFIFPVLAEEFGLLGSMMLIFLYLCIIARGFWLVHRCEDRFSRLLGAALCGTFFIYVFVNIGMVCGILPVVGVPLPFFSYGGTSILSLMGAFGLLMSLYLARKRHHY